MNKYLMLVAAALVAGPSISTAANSGHAVISPHGISPGGSYCDLIDLTWQGDHYADVHDWTPCGLSSASFGMGIAGYTKNIPGRKTKENNVSLSDYYVGDVEAGYDVDFQIGLPLKSGSYFNGYYTINGVDVVQYITGYYIIESPDDKSSRAGTRPSTIDALRAYIAKHN